MSTPWVTVNLTLGQVTDFRYFLRILLHERMMEILNEHRFKVDNSNLTIVSKIMEYQDYFKELESPLMRAQSLLTERKLTYGSVQFPLQMAIDLQFILEAPIPESYIKTDNSTEIYEMVNKAREGLLLSFMAAINSHDQSTQITQFNNEAKA